MIYGSNLEPSTYKECAHCGTVKSLDQFHRQPTGSLGRHSYCKICANAVQKATRRRNYSKVQKRKWALKTRYGITEAQYTELFKLQGNKCAICGATNTRLCVDHCHETGVVRGIVCHRCNVRLGGWDDPNWRNAALDYLDFVR